MCEGCYEEAGSPSIVNDKTIAAATLIERVYEHALTGGNLHIVLDDWNIRNSDIKFCAELIKTGGRGTETPEELAVERMCCESLSAMTKEERASALAISRGYLGLTLQPNAVDPTA